MVELEQYGVENNRFLALDVPDHQDSGHYLLRFAIYGCEAGKRAHTKFSTYAFLVALSDSFTLLKGSNSFGISPGYIMVALVR